MGSVRDDNLYDGAAMRKFGIAIEIPGFGERVIHTVISDYTGTLSCHGKLSPGVRPLLLRLAKLVDIEIITADTYGTAHQQLKEIVLPHMLRTKRQDVEKRTFTRKFDLRHVAALGNGNNDRLMLAAVKTGGLAIAVDNGEGCSVDALVHAHVFISGAANAPGPAP
jgi:soluble P-type ATPase